MKAATRELLALSKMLDISIHAAREGGDGPRAVRKDVLQGISIHAAREGGDEALRIVNRIVHISIHAAREGGDRRKTPASKD